MSEEHLKQIITIWLENCAALGRDALKDRPNCDTTYVEMAANSIMNDVKNLGKEVKNVG